MATRREDHKQLQPFVFVFIVPVQVHCWPLEITTGLEHRILEDVVDVGMRNVSVG